MASRSTAPEPHASPELQPAPLLPANAASAAALPACAPCPMGIDIGLTNKYYDLARLGDDMAAGHYRNLSVRADACVQCGHCEKRCPFHVRQMERMDEIRRYFGTAL